MIKNTDKKSLNNNELNIGFIRFIDLATQRDDKNVLMCTQHFHRILIHLIITRFPTGATTQLFDPLTVPWIKAKAVD